MKHSSPCRNGLVVEWYHSNANAYKTLRCGLYVAGSTPAKPTKSISMERTGYREMLRDRCPVVVSYALKWCRAKEAWLDHVYKSWIWMYSDSKERLEATKTILGYNNPHKQFIFEDTIAWDDLTPEETSVWKSVAEWVSWFQQEYSYIENEYSISKKVGKDISEIKLNIMTKHLKSLCPTTTDDAETIERKNKYINAFVDYLISCFESK